MDSDEAQAIAAIEKLGGRVLFDEEQFVNNEYHDAAVLKEPMFVF